MATNFADFVRDRRDPGASPLGGGNNGAGGFRIGPPPAAPPAPKPSVVSRRLKQMQQNRQQLEEQAVQLADQATGRKSPMGEQQFFRDATRLSLHQAQQAEAQGQLFDPEAVAKNIEKNYLDLHKTASSVAKAEIKKSWNPFLKAVQVNDPTDPNDPSQKSNEGFTASVRSGTGKLAQAIVTGAVDAGLIDPANASFAYQIARDSAARNRLAEQITEAGQEGGFGQGLQAMADAFKGDFFGATGNLLNLVTESFVQFAPAMATGGATAMFVNSLGVEYTNQLITEMEAAGYDPNNPNDMRRAWADPAFMSKARDRAVDRGLPVAVIDGIFTRVAGNVFKPAEASGLTGAAVRTGGELALQAGGGALSEIGGQIGLDGKITDPGAIIIEAISELGTGPVEVYNNLKDSHVNRKQQAKVAAATMDFKSQLAQKLVVAGMDPQQAADVVEPLSGSDLAAIIENPALLNMVLGKAAIVSGREQGTGQVTAPQAEAVDPELGEGDLSVEPTQLEPDVVPTEGYAEPGAVEQDSGEVVFEDDGPAELEIVKETLESLSANGPINPKRQKHVGAIVKNLAHHIPNEVAADRTFGDAEPGIIEQKLYVHAEPAADGEYSGNPEAQGLGVAAREVLGELTLRTPDINSLHYRKLLILGEYLGNRLEEIQRNQRQLEAEGLDILKDSIDPGPLRTLGDLDQEAQGREEEKGIAEAEQAADSEGPAGEGEPEWSDQDPDEPTGGMPEIDPEDVFGPDGEIKPLNTDEILDRVANTESFEELVDLSQDLDIAEQLLYLMPGLKDDLGHSVVDEQLRETITDLLVRLPDVQSSTNPSLKGAFVKIVNAIADDLSIQGTIELRDNPELLDTLTPQTRVEDVDPMEGDDILADNQIDSALEEMGFGDNQELSDLMDSLPESAEDIEGQKPSFGHGIVDPLPNESREEYLKRVIPSILANVWTFKRFGDALGDEITMDIEQILDDPDIFKPGGKFEAFLSQTVEAGENQFNSWVTPLSHDLVADLGWDTASEILTDAANEAGVRLPKEGLTEDNLSDWLWEIDGTDKVGMADKISRSHEISTEVENAMLAIIDPVHYAEYAYHELTQYQRDIAETSEPVSDPADEMMAEAVSKFESPETEDTVDIEDEMEDYRDMLRSQGMEDGPDMEQMVAMEFPDQYTDQTSLTQPPPTNDADVDPDLAKAGIKSAEHLSTRDPATQAEMTAVKLGNRFGAVVLFVEGMPQAGTRIGNTILLRPGMEDTAVMATLAHELTHTTGLDKVLGEKLGIEALKLSADMYLLEYIANREPVVGKAQAEAEAALLAQDTERLKREAAARMVEQIVLDKQERLFLMSEDNKSYKWYRKLASVVSQWLSGNEPNDRHSIEIIAEFQRFVAEGARPRPSNAALHSRVLSQAWDVEMSAKMSPEDRALLHSPEFQEEMVQLLEQNIDDKEAREVLVAGYAGMIRLAARWLSQRKELRSVDADDLYQRGIFQALDMLSGEKGAQFLREFRAKQSLLEAKGKKRITLMNYMLGIFKAPAGGKGQVGKMSSGWPPLVKAMNALARELASQDSPNSVDLGGGTLAADQVDVVSEADVEFDVSRMAADIQRMYKEGMPLVDIAEAVSSMKGAPEITADMVQAFIDQMADPKEPNTTDLEDQENQIDDEWDEFNEEDLSPILGPDGLPEMPKVSELAELTIPQLERLAKKLNLDTSDLSKKVDLRKSQLVKRVADAQVRLRQSLLIDVKMALEANEVANYARAAAALNKGSILASGTPIDQTSQVSADPAVIEKLAVALRAGESLSNQLALERRLENARRASMIAALQKAVVKGTRGLRETDEKTGQEVGAEKEMGAIMRGALSDLKLPLDNGYLSEKEYNELARHLLTHPSVVHLSALRKQGLLFSLKSILVGGKIPAPHEAYAMNAIFGTKVGAALSKRLSKGNQALEVAAQMWNFPRSLIAAFDLSATFRQGLSMWLTNPVISGRAFGTSIRSLFSQKNAEAAQEAMRKDPDYDTIVDTLRVYVPDLDPAMAALTGREEEMISTLHRVFLDWTRKAKGKLTFSKPIAVPVFAAIELHAHGLDASARAYITYLNQVRFHVAKGMLQALREEGYSETNREHVRHFREIGKFINSATGRGNMRDMAGAVGSLLFFSPRFMASRFEHIMWRLPKNALSPSAPKALRRQALTELAGQATLYTVALQLIALAAQAFDWDAEAETNPLSSEWGKLRVGNTRIDFSGGYGQVIKLLATLPYAAASSGEDLVRKGADGKEYKQDLGQYLANFGRSKLSPSAGTVWDMVQGSTPGRQVWTPTRAALQLTVPINVQESVSLVDEWGAADWSMALAAFTADSLGLGSNTYESGSGLDRSQFSTDAAISTLLTGDDDFFTGKAKTSNGFRGFRR